VRFTADAMDTPGSLSFQTVFSVLNNTQGATFPNWNTAIASSGCCPYIVQANMGTSSLDSAWDGPDGTFFVNGTAGTSFAPLATHKLVTKTLDTAASQQVRIGWDRNIGGRNWDGDFAEVILFEDLLTGDEITGINSILADKWDLPTIIATPAQVDAGYAALGISGPGSPPPLLKDGSFEDVSSSTVGTGQASELGSHNYLGSTWGNDDILNQWDKVQSRTWIMTDGTDNEFPDGSVGVRLDGVDKYNARLFQTGIALEAFKEYELSLSVWGEGGTPGIGAQFVGQTSGDVVGVFSGQTTDTTDGVAEVKTATFVPTGTEDYTIELYATNGSHTWIDAVNLDATGVTVTPPTNLLRDGSFEVNTNGTPGTGANSELGAHNYAGSTWGDADVTTHWDKHDRIWYVTDGGDSEFTDGNFAYVIDASLDHNGVDRLWQDGIALEAGKSYMFSLDMWGQGGNPILDATLTGPDTIVLFDDTTSIGNDGAAERKSVLFTPSVTGSYQLDLFTDVHSHNHTWIDNAVLDEIALGPNLLTDGSFEVNTNGTPGTGANSELGAHNYAGSTWGNDDVTTHWDKHDRIWYVTDGGDAEFTDGDFAYVVDASLDHNGLDKLWQDGIALEADTEYLFSFDMWGQGGNPILDATLTGPDTIVLFDDTTSLGNNNAAERKSVLFTPSVTGSYRLDFFTDVHSHNHTWIDNAAIQAVQSAAVPEPSTFALAALGLLGLGLVARRRKR